MRKGAGRAGADLNEAQLKALGKLFNHYDPVERPENKGTGINISRYAAVSLSAINYFDFKWSVLDSSGTLFLFFFHS